MSVQALEYEPTFGASIGMEEHKFSSSAFCPVLQQKTESGF